MFSGNFKFRKKINEERRYIECQLPVRENFYGNGFSASIPYLMPVILLVFTFVFQAMSQNYISGEITKNTRWRGKIYINGDVTVPQGVVLTIEEGCNIYFAPKTDVTMSGKDKERSELIVNGILRARSADPVRPITFTSSAPKPQMNDWYGITIKNFFDQSLLENCIVEFAYKGLTCYGSSPRVSGGEFRFNHHSGISCEVKSNPLLQNIIILGNGFSGINCELASNPVITGCTISENNFGVVIFSRSAPDLGTAPATGSKSAGRNRISNNFDFDIYNHSSEKINAQNNLWISASSRDIAAVIYDNQDNSSYGAVIYRPVYSERRNALPYASSVATLSPPGTTAVSSDTVPVNARQSQIAANDSMTAPEQIVQPGSSLVAANTTAETPVMSTSSIPDTFYAYRESRVKSAPPVQENPPVLEPMLEAFLDNGKRQYMQRTAPVYPEIYRKTGTEGDVLIEVIVDRLGTIDEYRVLKSDGDLFTEAAVEALKKFRYKPGLYKNEPVRFKIIERFRFKMN